MFKNNIKINKIILNLTKKKINNILYKKKINYILYTFLKIKNLTLNKTNLSNLNKKCIYTNKNKKLFKNINITRWQIQKKNLKFNINKW